MANVNKVMLIGRLTREPESRTFSNGGKVTTFGFAVSGPRRKNQQSGQWEDGDPMFIDCKVFNRGEFGKKADTAQQYLHKGDLTYLEGRLVLEQWDDKATGQKRSKHVLNVEDFQFLQPRKDGGGGGNYQRAAASAPAMSDAPPDAGYDEMEPPMTPSGKDASDDIPF
ncbi:MAG TPA: single-stranded DNA-binding protein [Gemmataceae bacterium]|nr:single-stranded DNA-binding protein [Gemmataceae bacterium]